MGTRSRADGHFVNARTAQDLVTYAGVFAVGLLATRAAGHGLARLMGEDPKRWERGATVGYLILLVPPIVAGFATSVFVPGYEEERWLGTWFALSVFGYAVAILTAVAVRRRARQDTRRTREDTRNRHSRDNTGQQRSTENSG